MHASELRKTFNMILSNYDTCTEKMRLVVNSIALSMNEITQTDGQTCGIFRHVDRNQVDEDYASKQSNREKFFKKNGKRNLQCYTIQDTTDNNNLSPCVVNRKSLSACGFCGSNEIGENISNCQKELFSGKSIVNMLSAKVMKEMSTY